MKFSEKAVADCPLEFTEHQRAVFCVFSGQGVVGLRKHLNRIRQAPLSIRAGPPRDSDIFHGAPPPPADLPNPLQAGDGGFDDLVADAEDDDDGLEDGTEMVIDTQPLLYNHQNTVLDWNAAMMAWYQPPVPDPQVPQQTLMATYQPPAPEPQMPQQTLQQNGTGTPFNGSETPFEPFRYVAGHPPYIPQPVTTPGEPATLDTTVASHHDDSGGQQEGNGDVGDNAGAADTASSAAPHPQSAAVPGPTASNANAGQPNHPMPIHHAHMDITTPGAVILEQQRNATDEHQASHPGGSTAA
jgi:F-box and leucine-rich repeat protein GRR1